jgi:O-antigen/teichoic acid export membrane protein
VNRVIIDVPKPELSQQLVNASFWAFIVYGLGAGITCLSQLVIARMIGASSFGIFSYVQAWLIPFSYLSTLGFNMVLLRFVPTYSATERWALARGVIVYAFRRSFLVSLAIAIAGTALVLTFANRMQHELTVSLVIRLATVPLFVLYILGGATVRTLGGVVSSIAPERLVRDGLLLVSVLLAGLFMVVDATTVLGGLMFSSAATVALLGFSLYRLWPAQLAVTPRYAPREWWHLAVPVLVMMAADNLMCRVGVILLGWSGDIHAAGIFALGLNLALFLNLPLMAIGTFFAPNVARLHAQKNMTALQNLFTKAAGLSLLGALLLGLPLLVLLEPLLRFFGPDFAATAPIARILILGQLLVAATGPQEILLTMTGHQQAAAVFQIAGTVVTVIACVIGIAYFGIYGAAMATAITNVIWNTAMAVYSYKYLNIGFRFIKQGD